MRLTSSSILLLFASVLVSFPVKVFAVDLKWESPETHRKVSKKVAEVESVIRKGPFKEDWESLKRYQAPDWFRDAKFGIFIHWGLYSVPGYANEWYSRNMYQQGDDAFKHHVATYGPQNKFGYKDFIPLFTAKNYDPNHWAQLFRQAGAKYVVPVAEHHDGFSLYDSSFSRWTAKKMGPKRDLIGELAGAARKAGLVFGLSYHRAEHWWFMNGGQKFNSDVQDSRYADFYGPAQSDNTGPDEAYLRNWLARFSEMVDKYHPQIVGDMDWWIGLRPPFMPYLCKFSAFYYDRAAQWKKGVVITAKDKTFVSGAAIQDVEKGSLPEINPAPWQTDTTISLGSWAYLKDEHYKKADLLVRKLVDIVSKNGNLLLDIGPKPDGTIPKGEEDVLLEMGQWLKLNGEAIYGTRPWVNFGEGPTRDKGGEFNESGDYQEGDIRYTLKGNNLYIISLFPPTCALKAGLLGKKAAPALVIKDVTLLGTGDQVKWERTDQALLLPASSGNGVMPVVYRASLDGSALGPIQVHSMDQTLSAAAGFQNYSAQPLAKKGVLSMDGKLVNDREVTVGPFSFGQMELQYEAPKAGFYQVKVSVPGLGDYSGSLVLPALDLSGTWLFHKGDDLKWIDPALDDSGWEKVVLPGQWAGHGYSCDDCYGWYRLHLVLPKEWSGHSLVLPLGKIDDSDVTYFNGTEIGRMGDKKTTGWGKDRRYEVPAPLIHFGGDNVIAIQVYNISGGAGLYDGPLGPIEVK